MSRMVVLTRQSLVPGFQLAGVEAFGTRSLKDAQSFLQSWMQADESMLIAIDHDILSEMDAVYQKQLTACDHLYIVPIPGSHTLSLEKYRHRFISEMIRKAIGIQISFKGSQDEG
ncbi:MAG: hypothetical protein JEZ06_14725 [Anaerolineaceae bacterium]|nr:hypothetical protein [Anaerolineaceae bacterium]